MFKKIINAIYGYAVKRYEPEILGDAFCYMDNKKFKTIKNSVGIFMLLTSKLDLEEDIDSKLTKLHSLWRKDITRFSFIEHVLNTHYYVIVNYDVSSSMFKVYIEKKNIDSTNEKNENVNSTDNVYITEAEYKLLAKAIDIELKKMLLDKVKELNRSKLVTIE